MSEPDWGPAGLFGPQPGPPMAGSLTELLLPTPPAPPVSGHFRLDLEQAPQAIADLRRAAEEMVDMLRRARDLGRFPPAGLDEVSRFAVQQISEAAVGAEGSLTMALEQGAAEFERQAQALEDQLRTYYGVEELNLPPANPLEL